MLWTGVSCQRSFSKYRRTVLTPPMDLVLKRVNRSSLSRIAVLASDQVEPNAVFNSQHVKDSLFIRPLPVKDLD